MTKFVNDTHLSKAHCPIVVKELPKVTLTKLEQFIKAKRGILVMAIL